MSVLHNELRASDVRLFKCPPSFEEDPSWNRFEQHVSLRSKCVRSAIIAHIYRFQGIIWFLLPSVFFSNILLDWGKKTKRFIRFQNSEEMAQDCVSEGVHWSSQTWTLNYHVTQGSADRYTSHTVVQSKLRYYHHRNEKGHIPVKHNMTHLKSLVVWIKKLLHCYRKKQIIIRYMHDLPLKQPCCFDCKEHTDPVRSFLSCVVGQKSVQDDVILFFWWRDNDELVLILWSTI